MIIESIVTTVDAAGAVNVAPMGVEWGEEVIVVKPFLETTTFRNVRETGALVVNLTDVILPERNRPDVDDVPEEVREQMAFHPAMTIDEVLEHALEPAPAPLAA